MRALAAVVAGFLVANGPVSAWAATPAAPASQPAAEGTAGWRGDGSGCYPSAELPARWSAKENIVWKTEIGPGQSSPVIAGGRVFLTVEPDVLVCLDAATGKLLWREAHKLSDMPAALNARAPRQSGQYGQASPTPVADGKSVWAFFHTGIVACHQAGGAVRWVRWYKMRSRTTYGRTASPVLIAGRLVVHFGPLACLDAATGKLLWQCDAAKATYGTPAAARIGNVDVVITPAGDLVRLADGKLLAGDLGHCIYTSPVVRGRMVYFIDRAMTAVELPASADEPVRPKELWYDELEGVFYTSPVVHGGRIYTVDRAANYFVLDAATGKTLLSKTLDLPPAGSPDPPNVYPSLCLAGKRLLIANDAGNAIILRPGAASPSCGRGSLPAGSGATAAFTGRRMFVRGGKFLYCVGSGK